MEVKAEKNQEMELSDDSLLESKEIEDIIDVKGRGQYSKYLVKWRGLEEQRNSWVTLDRVRSNESLLGQFRASRLKHLVSKSSQNRAKKRQEDPEVHTNLSEPKSLLTTTISSKRDCSRHNDVQENLSDQEVKKPVEKNRGRPKVKKQNLTDSDIEVLSTYIDSHKEENHLEDNDVRSAIYNSRKTAKVPNNVSGMKVNSFDIFKMNELIGGDHFVTSSSVTHPQSQGILRKDIQMAIGISVHQIFNNRLYFILRWRDPKVQDFYSKHYFTFQELETNNQKILLTYLKHYTVNSLK